MPDNRKRHIMGRKGTPEDARQKIKHKCTGWIGNTSVVGYVHDENDERNRRRCRKAGPCREEGDKEKRCCTNRQRCKQNV